MNLENKNILIIAAHPDDDILGCGGMIAKAIKNGSKIKILLGEGVSSRFNDISKNNKDFKLSTKARYDECKIA